MKKPRVPSEEAVPVDELTDTDLEVVVGGLTTPAVIERPNAPDTAQSSRGESNAHQLPTE